MDLAERFLKRIVNDVLADCDEDMQFFHERIDNTVLDSLKTIAGKQFQRLSYTQAIEILEKSGETFEFPISWGADLQAEHERFITEKYLQAPVILHDYPAAIKPFYMKVNDETPDVPGRTVRAMDVLVPRVGEIIGGSQREDRVDVLLARMTEQGLNPDDYWWYIELRKFGSVPHSGFGLGLERMVQAVTGMANIRDVIPFPRTPGNAEF
jgi:asparaginyl-tRNA synthetase